MSRVLGLERGGGWQGMTTDGLREFLEVAAENAVVLDLPEGIVLFVDVDGLQTVAAPHRDGRRSAGSVVALGRQADGLVPLDDDQEAWIQEWTETMRSSARRERLEAAEIG